MTDTDNAEITVIDRFDIFLPSPSVVPITIGNNGRIHGAKTVRNPAKIAIKRNNIRLQLIKLPEDMLKTWTS